MDKFYLSKDKNMGSEGHKIKVDLFCQTYKVMTGKRKKQGTGMEHPTAIV